MDKNKKKTNNEYQHLIQREVDKGEAIAIALAMKIKNFLRAKERGIINAVKPILSEIEQKTNFRLTPREW